MFEYHCLTIHKPQLLNRRPPFGHEVLASVREMPQYMLHIVEENVSTFGGRKPVEIDLRITCSLKEPLIASTKQKQRKSIGPTTVLTVTSELEFIDFRRIGYGRIITQLQNK